jgi:hypothetical protein
MRRALPIVVVLSFVVAAVSVLAQSQHLYIIPVRVFTAEPIDATLQLPDLAERRETVEHLRGYLFGQVNSSVRVDEVAKEARVAVEVVSRNINADDHRLRDVHLRVAAAGKSFSVDGSGNRWEDAARVAALKIRRWIAENAREIDNPPRLSDPIR